MNIETVDELIQSLESAGELSIKERKYLELAKAYQQLAAENVGPKEPTQAMCAAFNDSDYGRKSLRERYVAMLAAAPREVHDGQR